MSGVGLTLGFTGTQSGMRPRQLKAVRQLLWDCDTLHLGDCIGADTEAFVEAKHLGVYTVGHPPSDGKKRSFLVYDEVRPEKPYLIRNREIVADGVDGLIAAPKDFVQPINLRGQGTWTTIGYAKQSKRKIWLVLPDGRVNIL